MKIAVPTAEGKLCAHFGHCSEFVLFSFDESSRAISSEERLTPPPHAPGVLPAWLAEQGVSVVLAGGMGQRAQSLFERHGIRVVVGAPAAAPRELAEQWLAGDLVVGRNVCDH
jgi:predicted Fe-Mo cluster-binding NifX family protein